MTVAPRGTTAFDHVVVAGPTLDALVKLLRDETGVGAAPGGRHVGHGTHNALAHLEHGSSHTAASGEACYLELLALDPTQDGGPFGEGIAHVDAPTLHTWCLRDGDADDLARRIDRAGATARRLPMSRLRSDGSELAWELVFVDAHPFGPLVPFFVDWRGARHPAPELPRGLVLERFALGHPDHDDLRHLLGELGGVPAGVDVSHAERPTLGATLRGPRGTWHLHGAPRG
ncbi:MAG: VOC family protein [Trueperaceae bacterium]|nr:VOC family protein [Trueperaceae bacterium]